MTGGPLTEPAGRDDEVDADGTIDLSSRPFLADLTLTRARPAGQGASAGIANLIADLVTTTRTPPQQPVLAPEVFESTTPPPPPPATPLLPTPIPQTPVHASSRALVDAGESVDWAVVAEWARDLHMDSARNRGGFDVAAAPATPETADEVAGWEQIEALVDRHITALVLGRGEAADWSAARRGVHVQAVFDAAFRYGRLSQLLREDVENIDILGYDTVWVTLPDGTRQRRAPVADSDTDLEQLIAEIAADRGRVFARPHGTVRIDIGGARLTALAGPQIIPRPRLAIRRHRLVDVTLDHLVTGGALTSRMGEFLTASMRAYGSHLVSGYAGAGKSTLLRAMTAALPVGEPVVTIETERELYLDKLPHRHLIVDPLQYLPDVTRGDDRDAVFPLDTAIEYALRLNAQVLLFGEILGPAEAASAIKALQAGKGASSTIHAQSASDALQRFATALTQAGRLSDDAVPQQQILQTLDWVLQIELLPPTGRAGQRRVVTEIAEVVPGDAPTGRMARPITRTLYRWDPVLARHVEGETPSPARVDRLHRAGLPAGFFDGPRG